MWFKGMPLENTVSDPHEEIATTTATIVKKHPGPILGKRPLPRGKELDFRREQWRKLKKQQEEEDQIQSW